MDKMEIKGPQKVAVLMLALGEESCSRLFELMDEEEIREISTAMSKLGVVSAKTVESVFHDFSRSIGAAEVVIGNVDNTERLLRKSLTSERADQIMEEIRGPAGRTMWDKLGNVPEATLANYLRSEYPQTVAVILAKIKPVQAAQVLSLLPEDFSLDVMTRMLRMDSIQKDVLQRIEQTLRSEFVSNLARGSRRDSYEQMADIFNHLDRRIEGRYMEGLEARSEGVSEKIRSLMFTFEDLGRISKDSMLVLLNQVSREALPLALKGASEKLRTAFLGTMSERAKKMLSEEIESLGPVRVKDVDTAQADILKIAKDLSDRGEIELSEQSEGNEMIL